MTSQPKGLTAAIWVILVIILVLVVPPFFNSSPEPEPTAPKTNEITMTGDSPPTQPNSANRLGTVTLNVTYGGQTTQWAICVPNENTTNYRLWNNPQSCSMLNQRMELLEPIGPEDNNEIRSGRPAISIVSRRGTIVIPSTTSSKREERWLDFQTVLGPDEVQAAFRELFLVP